MKEFHRRDFANRTGLAQAWTVKSADRLFTQMEIDVPSAPVSPQLLIMRMKIWLMWPCCLTLFFRFWFLLFLFGPSCRCFSFSLSVVLAQALV